MNKMTSDLTLPQDPPRRPGAMDAFKLPSMHNGQPIPRKPPAAMCVGVKLPPVIKEK
jgi:hypothetical protein